MIYDGSTVRIAWRLLFAVRVILLFPLVFGDLCRTVRSRPAHHESRAIRWLNDLNSSTHGKGQDLLGRTLLALRGFRTISLKKDQEQIPEFPAASKEVDRCVAELRETGLTIIDDLYSREEAGKALFAGFKIGGRDDFGRRYDSVASWLEEQNSPRLFGSFYDENFLVKTLSSEGLVPRVVSRYLGCRPLIVSMNLWLTKAGAYLGPEDAGMNFHCDADYISFIKMFVILTDTPPNGGGTEFISGSHNGRRHVLGRISSTDATAIGSVIQASGPPGRVYLCDTRGWHRAGPPRDFPRGVLEIVFAADLFGKRPNAPFPLALNHVSSGAER